jgi:L-cysteine desulfidase
MNLYKRVVEREVFPALGCTEPISIAYAAGVAAEGLHEPPEEILFIVNRGTYKNGLAVTIPNTGGEKGNLIAGVLGCLIAKPEAQMEILRYVNPEILSSAQKIIRENKAALQVHPHCSEFYVEAHLTTRSHHHVCIISGGHTDVVYLERDGEVVLDTRKEQQSRLASSYREELRRCSIADLIDLASQIDEEDMAYLRQGVEMNLAMSAEGRKLSKVGFYLCDLMEKKLLLDDIFSSTKIMAACAVDARMDGMAMPVMSSGGSGNQGIVATLVPYNVGLHFGIDEKTIIRSIALSHLLNAYVKVFTGELAPICGCAIAAGVGAASAIVYQQRGRDVSAITFAINNIISDIGGLLCDGAKSGCALKVVSSCDSAIRSAYLGIHHYGITSIEGFVGHTAEETIANLNRITEIGMAKMDDTIVSIMLQKSRRL